LPLLIYGIINSMEEKSLENNSSAIKDRYREPIGEESVDSEEKNSLEKETPLDKEKSLEPTEKLTEEQAEAATENKIGIEQIEEKSPAEVNQAVGERQIEEEVKPTVAPPSAQARKKAKQLKDLDRPSQVKALSDLAFEKGLNFAVEVAKALDSAYVLDELHDALVDELYQKLIEEGKLKKL